MLYVGFPELVNLITRSLYSKEFKCYLEWRQSYWIGFSLLSLPLFLCVPSSLYLPCSLSLSHLTLDFKWSYPVFLKLKLPWKELEGIWIYEVHRIWAKSPGRGIYATYSRRLSCHCHCESQVHPSQGLHPSAASVLLAVRWLSSSPSGPTPVFPWLSHLLSFAIPAAQGG